MCENGTDENRRDSPHMRMASTITPHRDALLVIDVQNDFCSGGALAVPGGDLVVPIINRLMAGFERTVLTQDWHPPGHASFASSHAGRSIFETIDMPYGPQTLWPDHCVQDSCGAAFHPGLVTGGASMIIRKGTNPSVDSYSAFQENDRTTRTGLAGYLRERGTEHLYLCGLATDFCVAWSAMDAIENGFKASVLLDACRAIDLDGSLAAALIQLRNAGVTLIEDSGAIK